MPVGVYPRPTAKERFDKYHVVDEETGCWVWTGAINGNGYGILNKSGAHRWSYAHFKEEIPKGLCIDHLRRNRRCVNPEHLEAVTHKENMRRASKVWKLQGTRRTN